MDASCEQRGGGGMSEGREGHAQLSDPGTVVGGAEGALDPGATPGGGRRRAVFVMAPGGGQEPGRVTRGCPGGAEQSEGIFGQRDGAVFGALTSVDMDLEALAVEIGDWQREGCMEAESQARDGGEIDLMVPGGGGLEPTSDLLKAEDGGETVCGVSAKERQGVPVTFQDMLGEEADTTGAETHGNRGEAVDVVAVQAGVLQPLFGEQVGRCAIELSQQVYLTDVGLLSTRSFATELKRGHHLLAQWGHEISPFVSGRVVRVRRKTS
jgi:hypothetical protein